MIKRYNFNYHKQNIGSKNMQTKSNKKVSKKLQEFINSIANVGK